MYFEEEKICFDNQQFCDEWLIPAQLSAQIQSVRISRIDGNMDRHSPRSPLSLWNMFNRKVNLSLTGDGNIPLKPARSGNHTPLHKKRNTWFMSSHDPNLGSTTPQGQKVVSRGSFPNFEPYIKS